MTSIVDERLVPGAEQGNDMLASHIQSGLTRDELLAEVFLKVHVSCNPSIGSELSPTVIS